MSNNGQLLLQRLQESGFEIEPPEEESKSFQSCLRDAYNRLHDGIFYEHQNSAANASFSAAYFLLGLVGLVGAFLPVVFDLPSGLLMLLLPTGLALWRFRKGEFDIWPLALLLYAYHHLSFVNFSQKEVTREEVIGLFSQQLQERQERVLGIDLQDTLDQLRTDKQELENIRNQLEAKEESAHEQDMAGVWQEEMDHLDADIREYEMAIENIKSHLKQVRKLSAEIAEELLPSYREQEELANLLEKSVEARGDTKENIRGAYRALELSQQTLADRLGTIERLVNQAKQVSANLHQFIDEDDRKPERLREETETLDISVEGLESGEQETADTKMHAHA